MASNSSNERASACSRPGPARPPAWRRLVLLAGGGGGSNSSDNCNNPDDGDDDDDDEDREKVPGAAEALGRPPRTERGWRVGGNAPGAVTRWVSSRNCSLAHTQAAGRASSLRTRAPLPPFPALLGNPWSSAVTGTREPQVHGHRCKVFLRLLCSPDTHTPSQTSPLGRAQGPEKLGWAVQRPPPPPGAGAARENSPTLSPCLRESCPDRPKEARSPGAGNGLRAVPWTVLSRSGQLRLSDQQVAGKMPLTGTKPPCCPQAEYERGAGLPRQRREASDSERASKPQKVSPDKTRQ